MKLSKMFTFFAVCSTLFFEDFTTSSWNDHWVQSHWMNEKSGNWNVTNSKLVTTEDARFYAIAANITKFVAFDDHNTLTLQYSVKFPKTLSCAGAYIKLFPPLETLEIRGGENETQYSLMFGPDVCGSQKLHAIIPYNGSNRELTKKLQCNRDDIAHMYTITLYSNTTVYILIDGDEKARGDMRSLWPLLPPEKIPDPSKPKPKDWVDDEYIPDPKSVKPDDYDDIPETIPDPDAVRPEDWDTEEDGDWESPMIPNPKYLGEWKPEMIKNPDYKGPYVVPEINNPDFVDDDSIGQIGEIGAIGFDLWQVSSNVEFGDIMLTTNESEATEYLENWLLKRNYEKEVENIVNKESDEESDGESDEKDEL
jgi:calreticulin